MIGPSSGQPLKTTKTINEAFEYAYANGYAGAMSWAMSESNSSFFGDYSTTAPALETIFAAHGLPVPTRQALPWSNIPT